MLWSGNRATRRLLATAGHGTRSTPIMRYPSSIVETPLEMPDLAEADQEGRAIW